MTTYGTRCVGKVSTMETPENDFGQFQLVLPGYIDEQEIRDLFQALERDVEGFDQIVINAIETVNDQKSMKNGPAVEPEPVENIPPTPPTPHPAVEPEPVENIPPNTPTPQPAVEPEPVENIPPTTPTPQAAVEPEQVENIPPTPPTPQPAVEPEPVENIPPNQQPPVPNTQFCTETTKKTEINVPCYKTKKTNEQTRFKKLNQEDLDEMEQSVYSAATKRNTKWGIGVFNAWCMETYGHYLDLKAIEEPNLNECLRKFYAEAQPKAMSGREKKFSPELGNEYHKNSMKNVRAAINRHLKDSGRVIDIVNGTNFTSANKMLCAKLKNNLKTGVSRPTQHYPVIDAEELTKIHEYLKKDDPVTLRLRIWYLFAIHFVTRGLEFHRQLKMSSVLILTDATGSEYITLSHETLQKNHQGGTNETGGESSDKRMYANGTEMCPVASVKKFLEKTDASAVSLFNQCTPGALVNKEETLWYGNKPVKPKGFSTFMPDLCKNACLSKRYTAHSLRATAIQSLSDAGFENRNIMFMSDHKSEMSLKHYTRTPSIPQKRAISNVLQNMSAGGNVGIPAKIAKLTIPNNEAVNVMHPPTSSPRPMLPSVNHGWESGDHGNQQFPPMFYPGQQRSYRCANPGSATVAPTPTKLGQHHQLLVYNSNQHPFRHSDGVNPLVCLLRSGNDEVRRNTAWAMTVCASDEPTATEICKAGGMELLQEIQSSSTRRSPFTDAALQKLLDNNLSAKYALAGCLGPTNYIENGFYDIGQLKPGTRFLTIEEYSRQEMNDKRPIILINAKPDPAASQSRSLSDLDAKHDGSKTSISGKPSRTGRDSKTKTRKQQEREEREREAELQAQLQREADAVSNANSRPYDPPCDATLLKFIDEVVEKIQPLATSREQVSALASYVAEKMGGPIERGQLGNFSWELPISQIKFEFKSNIIPLGKLKTGIHVHRALLFKVLADKVALSCSLVRGEYNRAWNEVLLPDQDYTPGAPKFPPKSYIVDLIHTPGALLRSDSPEAVTYQKI